MKKQIQMLTLLGVLSCSIVSLDGMKKKPTNGININTKGNNHSVVVPVIKKNDTVIQNSKIVVPQVKKQVSILDENGKIRPQYLDDKGNFKNSYRKKN